MSIVYIGMDVHKNSYTLCCYNHADDEVKFVQKINSEIKYVIKYIEMAQKHYGEAVEFICGYEAGAMGYKLYHEMNDNGFKCIIMAPTTMGVTNTNGVKTDKRDAVNIARCLAYKLYSPVFVPTLEDEEVKEYMRMRDDQKKALKKVKQQILALVLRQGNKYNTGGSKKSYWTQAHIKWLKTLKFNGYIQEALEEYFIQYEYMVDKLERLDERIEEISKTDRYQENVEKLSCFLGVKTHTAMSVIVETGDFKRFKKASQYAAFLGLVPGENSSAERKKQNGITKAGNSHLRRLLIEAANAGYSKGQIGHKSKELKRRQKGNSIEVIAYADKCNERLRRKYYRMTLSNNSPRNVAVTAVAREVACFMWGMMNGKID